MNRNKALIILIISSVVFLVSCSSQASVTDEPSMPYDVPEIEKDTNLGADLPFIHYESEDEIIFSHYLGIFIYDLDSEKMIRAIKPWDENLRIGAQGDTTSIVEVDKENEAIIVYNIGRDQMDYYYQYNMDEDIITKHSIEELPTDIEYEEATGYMNTSNWSVWDLTYTSAHTGRTYYPYRSLLEN